MSSLEATCGRRVWPTTPQENKGVVEIVAVKALWNHSEPQLFTRWPQHIQSKAVIFFGFQYVSTSRWIWFGTRFPRCRVERKCQSQFLINPSSGVVGIAPVKAPKSHRVQQRLARRRRPLCATSAHEWESVRRWPSLQKWLSFRSSGHDGSGSRPRRIQARMRPCRPAVSIGKAQPSQENSNRRPQSQVPLQSQPEPF